MDEILDFGRNLEFPGVIGILLLLIAFFLLIRELRTWYGKIDKVVSLLESLDDKLGILIKAQKHQFPDFEKEITQYEKEAATAKEIFSEDDELLE